MPPLARLTAGDVPAAAVDLAQRLLDHERLVDACSRWPSTARRPATAALRLALATLRVGGGDRGEPRLLWVGGSWPARPSTTTWRRSSTAPRTGIGDAHDPPVGGRRAPVRRRDDPDRATPAEMRRYLVPDNSPILDSPIVCPASRPCRPCSATTTEPFCYAETALRDVDEESSLLLCLVLLARAAATLGSDRLITELTTRLEPWRGHVATPADGWRAGRPGAGRDGVRRRSTDRARVAGQAVSIIETVGDRRAARRADEPSGPGNDPFPSACHLRSDAHGSGGADRS